MANEYYTKTYTIEGFRFPTTKELGPILQEVDKINYESRYSLRKTFFPENATTAYEIEMYAQKSYESGMTYFHAYSSEPRMITRGGLEVTKVTWKGAPFRETQKWDEEKIIFLGQLNERVATSQIKEEIAEAAAVMTKRMIIRQEWLAAEVLTKGVINVSTDTVDNPAGIAYTVDYNLAQPNLTVTNDQKWDKIQSGKYTADILGYFYNLRQSRLMATDRWNKYLPSKLLMNSVTFNVLQQNVGVYEMFLKAAYITGSITGSATADVLGNTPMLLGSRFQEIFKQYTGLDILIYDERWLDHDNTTWHKFIPDGHVTVINDGPGQFGEFTYTGHAHGGGNGTVTVGTGRFLLAEDHTNENIPYYQLSHGFHGLPRLLDYDTDFKNYRLQFMNVFGYTP